jgi:hypothetical protein
MRTVSSTPHVPITVVGQIHPGKHKSTGASPRKVETMKKSLLPIGTLGVAGLVGVGLLSFPTTTVSAGLGDEAVTKRDDQAVELVLVDDDDDDDSKADSRSRTTRGTGSSRSRADGTNSRYSKVSRDRDRSRGDLTKDWTKDGPGSRTRDFSQNKTNDRSRHDTR